MNIKTAYSNKESIDELITDIKYQLMNFESKLVLYFASSVFVAEELSSKMQDIFKDTAVFGCSTSGEIISGKMLEKSVVVMAFNSNIIENVKIEVIENLPNEEGIENALKSFESHFDISMREIDYKKYLGIILIDGLSVSEEKVMDKIGNLTDIFFVGGSAGDDLKFEKTYVFANGKAYTDAAILALIKPATEYGIIKTQSFCSLEKHLTVTKADEEKRKVIEFNEKPAKVAYAEALGVEADKLSDKFMKNPVGLMMGDEPYVRSPQQVQDDNVVFYCNVKEGMDLAVLESTDIIEDTKKAIENSKQEIGQISGLINFHCILRTLELKDKNLTEEYGKVFSNIPTIGFSTYGEQYLGHINQTSTMIVFK